MSSFVEHTCSPFIRKLLISKFKCQKFILLYVHMVCSRSSLNHSIIFNVFSTFNFAFRISFINSTIFLWLCSASKNIFYINNLTFMIHRHHHRYSIFFQLYPLELDRNWFEYEIENSNN